jgi:gamma-glutamyltranspeptidase/glutathione hydrolase
MIGARICVASSRVWRIALDARFSLGTALCLFALPSQLARSSDDECAAARLPNDMVARGKAGVVVSCEPHATAAGLAVLRDGGNAVDAAVAVALTLAVTHPQAGNLGGGGFLLVRMADGTTTSFDFRECAPQSATAGMYLRADGTLDDDKVRFGASSAGVPGSPAGLHLALQRFGTKPLRQLAAPAIALAKHGFPVDQFLAEALVEEQKALARFATTRAIFFRGDEPLRQGDMLLQPDLAATLQRYADLGPDGFYKGVTAERIAAHMKASGGFVTEQDLANYRAVERAPLRGSYRGHEVISMPPPSSGGVALLQMLNLLEPYDLRGMGYGSSRTLHLLTEVMRRAYADRSKWLGDPDHYAVPTEGLISKAYADSLRQGLRTDRRSDVAPGLPPGAKESDDTTHFSVVDKEGNAVACTTTINNTFGSADVVAGCGFLLNDEMDDFAARPGTPNMFGLVGGKANAIAPNKRMLSSMTPTIVVKDGKVRLVLGAPGGGRIITGVLQVLLNVVDHGMRLETAVRAPRIHHQWTPDVIAWEELALSQDVRDALASMGHTFEPRPRGIGRVQSIAIAADGERIGVCDHRSGGSAAAQ